jgi:hypothetical protein
MVHTVPGTVLYCTYSSVLYHFLYQYQVQRNKATVSPFRFSLVHTYPRPPSPRTRITSSFSLNHPPHGATTSSTTFLKGGEIKLTFERILPNERWSHQYSPISDRRLLLASPISLQTMCRFGVYSYSLVAKVRACSSATHAPLIR